MGDVNIPPLMVFSAHAEVVPLRDFQKHVVPRILRARGGSSIIYQTVYTDSRYSPRTRR